MKIIKIWTASEIDQLRSAYSIWPPDLNALSISIGRSKASIKMKAREVGLSKGNTLTDDEKEYITKNSSIASISQVSRNINRSHATISRFIRENNLHVKKGANNKWIPTEQELEVIKSSSWSMIMELSEKLGKSTPLIRKQMRLMGIVKPIVIRVPRPKREPRPRPIRLTPINRTPRVKKEPKPKIVKVKIKEIEVPRNISGENRIREAIARLGLNK